ncbi:hypothetical protein Hamer_G010018 [Homarus americanus]|uniref:Uncharacterized protein n=1 Tax=Homarus americanus TaxID=6706 RepID=A0A8J5MMR3_HOMAM|nr:hypothetical protein Hamer_G010018 [Homarus americanus]
MTDILIVLWWHMTPGTPSIYFRPESRQGSKRASRCWNMEVMRTMLGSEVCVNILFVHAILGCDTTSSLYGVGKKIGLKLIHTTKVFLEQAQVFSKRDSTQADIIKAGESALVHIYKGLQGYT